jgi:predicted phosphodiesterase
MRDYYLLVLISTWILSMITTIPVTFAERNLAFDAVGDITDVKVCDAVKKNPKSVIVLLGDYYGETSGVVKCFKQANKKVIVVVGNHDSCSSVRKFNPCTYSYVRNGVAFQTIDTNQKSISQTTTQGKIVEENFKKWQADPEIYLIVVAIHKTAIVNNDSHHNDAQVNKEIKGLRAFLTYLANTYQKFNLLLEGHDHKFLVCKPDNPKILVWIDGTGGRDPYPMGKSTDDGCQIDKGLSGSKYNGFSEIRVYDDGRIVGSHKIASQVLAN